MKYIILLLAITINLSAKCTNPDILIKSKYGYRFACSKIEYNKKQAIEINSKLYRKKKMNINLSDRKVNIEFNHYKVLSFEEIMKRRDEELARMFK